MLACCVLIVVGQESCVWVFFAIGSLCGSSCVSASVCFGVSVVGFQRRYAILHKCGCRATPICTTVVQIKRARLEDASRTTLTEALFEHTPFLNLKTPRPTTTPPQTPPHAQHHTQAPVCLSINSYKSVEDMTMAPVVTWTCA